MPVDSEIVRRWIIAVVIAAITSCTWSNSICRAQTTRPELTPALQEVVKLADASVGEETILAFIRNSSVSYRPTADQIIYLKSRGMSEKVIHALVQAQAPATAPATAPSQKPSFAVPTETDGGAVVRNKIAREAEGRLRLLSFRKTNGQSAEIRAIPIYTLEWDCDIEVVEDCKWLTGEMIGGSPSSFRTARSTPAPKNGGFSWDNFYQDTQNPGAAFTKGQRQRVGGRIVFESTENGWRATRFDMALVGAPMAAGAPQESTLPSRGGRPNATQPAPQRLPTTSPGSVESIFRQLGRQRWKQVGFRHAIAKDGEPREGRDSLEAGCGAQSLAASGQDWRDGDGICRGPIRFFSPAV